MKWFPEAKGVCNPFLIAQASIFVYYQQKDNKIVVTAVKNSVGEPDDLVWVMFGLPQYA